MHSGGTSAVLIVVLVAWGLYRRIRRTIGKQRLAPRRLWIRGVLLALVAIMFAVQGIHHPRIWLFEALGLVIGIVFTLFVMRTTEFEVSGEDVFYRTNMWMGIAVMALFIGRLVYRFVEIYAMSGHIQQSAQNPAAQGGFNTVYTSDPWTAGFYYILCTYYVMFTVFLLLQNRRLRQNPAEIMH